MSVTRADVVAEARTWIGTPYRLGHRAKGVGVDCAGIVIGVARELGLVPPDFDIQGYTDHPDGMILGYCARHMQRIGPHRMLHGDVLVFAVGRLPQHMGIVGDYKYGGYSVIHALNDGAGRVVEHRLVFGETLRFVAAFQLPGMSA